MFQLKSDAIMKKLHILLILFTVGLAGCSDDGIPGPQGPPGRDGFDGRDGLNGLDGEESFVFEYEFSFIAPEYSALLELPLDFNILDSDVMLVYLLWEITDNGTEIWRLLPQTLYLPDGIVSYNYDFTKFDASVFMDGTLNLDALGAEFTDNWIARVVVVPGQFSGRSTLDFSNYDEVKEQLGLPDSKLASAEYTKRPN